MILGLYKHYKGGWYIGLFSWAWESTNGQPRVRKVIYLSLGRLLAFRFKEVVNIRERDEFRGTLHACERATERELDDQRNDCGELLHVVHRFKRIVPWWQP